MQRLYEYKINIYYHSYIMLTKSEIKSLKSLQQKKFRDEEKSFLVEGKRSVEEAIAFKHIIEKVYITHQLAETDSYFTKKLDSLSISYEIANAKDIDAVSDVQNSQGIIAKAKFMEFDFDSILENDKTKAVMILDGIADPGNMGTIIRTADWFGMNAIVTCNNCVDIYNPKVVRSTMGSIFHLPIIKAEDNAEIFTKLKSYNFLTYAADLEGDSYQETVYSNKAALIFGNEAHGISSNLNEYIDYRITIPKTGNAESLNVAISAGIIISQVRSIP